MYVLLIILREVYDKILCFNNKQYCRYIVYIIYLVLVARLDSYTLGSQVPSAHSKASVLASHSKAIKN